MLGSRPEERELKVRELKAFDIPDADGGVAGGVSEPYVKVACGEATAQTTVKSNKKNADWGDEELTVALPMAIDNTATKVVVSVWDKDEGARREQRTLKNVNCERCWDA